ncbi:MAG: 30S ribosomal protein S2 [Solibacterales bacterium]|nr:30S ribosomal protein S2 [Bryobacterales bacterium]
MAEITMKELLESGVHFGHQIRRWNPKMKEYIFGERNGIHIIDLQKTFKAFKEAAQFVTDSASEGKTVLFVGTKRQAQEAVATEAVRCGQYYINSRWLGGLLTNWSTVQKSIQRLKDLEVLADQEGYEGRSKKEVSRLERERKHLHQNLRGIKEMPGIPDILFVIDSGKEDIAIREAKKLDISIVAVVDTNSDPTPVDYVIPGNDDALRAIRLFSAKIADAVLAGTNMAVDQATAEGADDVAVGADATEEATDATEEAADATEELADVEVQNNGESDSEVVPDVDTITETATAADEVPQKLHPDTVSEESADVSTTEGESIKVQSGTTGLEPGNDL